MKRTLKLLMNVIIVSLLQISFVYASNIDLEILEPEASSKRDLIIPVNWKKVITNEHNVLEISESSEDRLVTKDSLVYLKIKNFNFIHYTPEILVSEKKIEAASFLSGLWDQFLGFNFDSLRSLIRRDSAVSVLAVETPEQAWLNKIIQIFHFVEAEVGKYRASSALSDDELKLIKDTIETLRGYMKSTSALEREVYQTIANPGSRYQVLFLEHQKAVAAANRYLNLASKSVDGDLSLIGNFEAGTAVEIVLIAEAQPTAKPVERENKAALSFLTHGSTPLKFHSGITYSALKDADFETIQELRGSEFQTRVVEGDETIGFSLFASYPLGATLNNAKIFATLGTDITDVGDTVYAGISYKLQDKWFITGGIAYGDTVETELIASGMMEPEPTGGSDIVQIIREDRDAEPFIAISYIFF